MVNYDKTVRGRCSREVSRINTIHPLFKILAKYTKTPHISKMPRSMQKQGVLLHMVKSHAGAAAFAIHYNNSFRRGAVATFRASSLYTNEYIYIRGREREIIILHLAGGEIVIGSSAILGARGIWWLHYADVHAFDLLLRHECENSVRVCWRATRRIIRRRKFIIIALCLCLLLPPPPPSVYVCELVDDEILCWCHLQIIINQLAISIRPPFPLKQTRKLPSAHRSYSTSWL